MPPNVPIDAGLRYACREITCKERRFVGGIDLAEDVRNGRVIGVVDDRELEVGIRLSRRLGGVAEQEADGDDDVAFLGDERVDVRHVVRLGLGLEQLALDPDRLFGILNAFPGGLVEALVVDAAEVGDLAGCERRCRSGHSAERGGGHKRDKGRGGGSVSQRNLLCGWQFRLPLRTAPPATMGACSGGKLCIFMRHRQAGSRRPGRAEWADETRQSSYKKAPAACSFRPA